MIDCNKIQNNILFSCDFPMFAGMRDRAWIINKDNVVSVQYNVTNKMVVEMIVLKSGSRAFYIDGINNSVQPNVSLIKGAFVDSFEHSVGFKLFDISPEQKENLIGGLTGTYLVITENNFKGELEDSAFEIYGLDAGLTVSAFSRDQNNADTQGAFDFALSTVKNKEPKLPRNFFIVSYTGTKAVIESLLTTVVINDFLFSNGQEAFFSNSETILYE